jgi:transposase
MRSADTFTESLFTMRRFDDFIPSNHPLREIRKMSNVALVKMEPLFAQMYEADSKGGRPSVAPEKLLRAMLLQVLYSVRSERQLMEQVQYNMLYRWFIGLAMDDSVWVPTVFTKNRERLIRHDAIIAFFNEVVAIAKKKNWLSGEHFSVDGTLIQAWAGHKSFLRKDEAEKTTTALVMVAVDLTTSMVISAATQRTTPPATRMRGCTATARLPVLLPMLP